MNHQAGNPESQSTMAQVAVGSQAVGFPMPIGEWLPGYAGAIALKHKNGSWSVAHSNQVDPTSEWRRGDKVESGPEMLRAGGYVAWVALELNTTTVVVPDSADAATNQGFLHVGNLSVFEDNESTFGHAYDISTNHKGHILLQALDGAELYAIRPTKK
jgi:hypothetical protein